MAASGLIESLVEFEHWDAESDFVSVNPATFKQDFGPWRSGECIDSLTLDVNNGMLEEADHDGCVLRSCAVKLVAVDTK